ncbi:rhodanese-like domain-containing protein [Candidatus Saccharibacteria bacterium]|nr:rhodanese-like domain-containing protein [Candidatus Saccharibacteria bacterium]
MKKGIIAVILAIALVGGFFLVSKPSSDDTASNATADSTSVTSFSQVQTAVADGGQLLDVRTAEEYSAGHIDGATNFSLQDLQASKLPAGNKDQHIFVYCHSGNRSGQATTILKSAGYTNVTDLGAMTHVESIGGNVVRGT